MSCGGKIFKELKHESSHVKLVYMVAEQLANCSDTVWNGQPIAAGQFITSINHMAEHCSLTRGFVRSAFDRLTQLGLLKIDGKGRRYTQVTLLSRNTVSNTVSNTAKLAKKQRESQSANTVSNTVSNNGVGVVSSVVVQDLDVDVSLAFEQKKGSTSARATPPVDKFKTTATAKFTAAIARAPRLAEVTMHIDRLFADLSKGHKYPWAGHPNASTMLADLIVSHGVPLVMAAAERFFQNDDPWIRERAWAIDEFSRQFAKFIAIPSVSRRKLKIEAELATSARPSTPSELMANLNRMRLDREKAFA